MNALSQNKPRLLTIWLLIAVVIFLVGDVKAIYIGGGTAGEIRVKAIHNSTEAIIAELNSPAFQKLSAKRLNLTGATLRGWKITLIDEEANFEVTGEFPNLSKKEANEVINLMIKYVSARRKAITKAQSEREVFAQTKQGKVPDNK